MILGMKLRPQPLWLSLYNREILPLLQRNRQKQHLVCAMKRSSKQPWWFGGKLGAGGDGWNTSGKRTMRFASLFMLLLGCVRWAKDGIFENVALNDDVLLYRCFIFSFDLDIHIFSMVSRFTFYPTTKNV